MGNLLNGKWTTEDSLSEIREGGHYIKNPSVFRNQVTADGSSGFKAETDRYHLYVSTSCPWAHRTMLFRVLKKLQGIVAMTDTSQTHGVAGAKAANEELNMRSISADSLFTTVRVFESQSVGTVTREVHCGSAKL